MKKLRFYLFLLLALSQRIAWGQGASIQLGPDQIGINQAWGITITLKNGNLESYSGFPEIPGFRKGGSSTQSETSVINGQASSAQSVTMSYIPTGQGLFTVLPFTLRVNGRDISSPGKKVRVGPPVQAQQTDPFRDFFDTDPAGRFNRGTIEFIDIQEDAFFALTTSKQEVYVGEGVTMALSFLVADGNRAPMQFFDLSRQLSRMLKTIKPANCWEENFNIEELHGEAVVVGGKPYTQYTIYQAAFYPLDAQPIRFPSVGLEMIKYKVAKNPSFFGQSRQEDRKTFYSKPKTVRVKKLPPHPLRESVAVGDYHLSEELSPTNVSTGESAAYQFRIYGEGNISAIRAPHPPTTAQFDFYDPNTQERIARTNGRVAGAKMFSYYLTPKESGRYTLGDYFSWIFFNPKSGRYDTLLSQKTLAVTGESQRNRTIADAAGGELAFYDLIDEADNALVSGGRHWVQPLASLLGLFSLVVVLVLTFKKKKKKPFQP